MSKDEFMSTSNWSLIESQDDLNKLNSAFRWGEETQTVEFYGCFKNEPYFPPEISRSGRLNVNLHLLVELHEAEKEDPDYVEFVLIDCEFHSDFINKPCFTGRVDSLKRVYLENGNYTEARCARLLYRYIFGYLNLHESPFFNSEDCC